MSVERVFAGLGSNVDREVWIPRGVTLIRAAFTGVVVSSVYESAAVGFSGDDFYNLVVGFDCDESPQALAAHLRSIEEACGRHPGSRRFAPRTLDVDLILYGDRVERGYGYRVPREDILNYAFVLAPLAEIAPEQQHPVLRESFAALWEGFDKRSQPLRTAMLALPGSSSSSA